MTGEDLFVAGFVLLVSASLGCGAAWGAQDLRYADRRAASAVITADNAELRETSQTLRRRCPARPRMQYAPVFTPGAPI